MQNTVVIDAFPHLILPCSSGTPSPHSVQTLVITFTFLAFIGASYAATLEGRTVKITDGDTLQVLLSNGLKEKVRLIGIDAPEKAQKPWGKQATAALERMVKNQWVRLETDLTPRDRYGRLLAYVYVGQTFVNLELMNQGNAVLLTYPPGCVALIGLG